MKFLFLLFSPEEVVQRVDLERMAMSSDGGNERGDPWILDCPLMFCGVVLSILDFFSLFPPLRFF